MGVMACPPSFHSKNDSQSESANPHESESNFLLSLPSLMVPSLTLQPPQQQPSLSISNTHHRFLTTLKGHNSPISSLTLAGKLLYTGSSDGEIRSWKRNPFQSESDPGSSTILNNLVAAGEGAVKSLVVQADKIFSAHQDHKIRVWRINNHETDHRNQKYTHLATLPTLGDRALKLLMPKNQVQIRRHKSCTWIHHVDAVSGLALSKDESFLYSVSWDRTLKIWRTKDFKCLESLTNAHDDAINALALSNDGYVYTGSADRKIKVWKKNSGDQNKYSLVATQEQHNSGINALALSSDGSVLYSGASDRCILLWEKGGGSGGMEVVGALTGHKNSILCLAVVSDLVCSGSADRTVRIWRRLSRNYNCLAVLDGHRGPVKCLTAAIDHRCNASEKAYLVYSGGLDCDIKVWQILVPS